MIFDENEYKKAIPFCLVVLFYTSLVDTGVLLPPPLISIGVIRLVEMLFVVMTGVIVVAEILMFLLWLLFRSGWD